MIVFSIVSVLPVLIISGVIYYISAASLEASMEEITSVFSSQITSDINEFIDNYDSLTRSLLVNSDLIENLSTDIPISQQIENRLYYRRMVLKLMTMESGIQSVTFMNDNGQYYQFDRNGNNIDYEKMAEQEWFQTNKKRGGTLFLTSLHDSSYYDKNKDQILITFGRRVYGTDGKFKGVILIDLLPSSLIKLSDSFLLERDQYNIKINITDADGGVIYDSDLASGRLQYSEIDEVDLLMYQKDSDNYLVIEDTTEDLGIHIHTVIPHSSMLLRVSYIQKITFILVVIMLAMIVLTSNLFSKRLVFDIRKLQGGMKKLEAGSYERIAESDSRDEIGSLVKSYNHMVGKMEELVEEIYQAGIRQKNAQFLALRAQINPHFLFNTLESIRIKAILNGDDAAADMIKLLAKIFRNVLDSDKKNYKVSDEMDNVRSYIQLQNLRFDNVITLVEDIEPEVYQSKIMSIVFQPVIENSFKYGSRESGIPICITITGRRTEGGQIVFSIHDNGKGMSPERLQEVRNGLHQPQGEDKEKGHEDNNSHEIGLRNIAERLRLRYGNDSDLRIVSSSEEGTVVEIQFPYTE